jgi:ATP-binding cassette subfamily F protein 3
MSIQLIRRAVPEADEAIVEYIDGYLRENDFEDDEDAIADFVKPILIDAGGEEDKIDELCEHLSSLLQANKKTDAKRGLSKLEHSVNMSQQNSLSATVNFSRGNADLEHVSGRRVQSQVNQDKLRKAEAKIAAKMAKRQEKSNLKVEYEASRLLDEQKALQEQYKLYNPILDYTTTKGKNKDIKVENFDISFAGRRILTDANLTLAFGRRYGVVGKNGIGKSTLLKAMARREIAVPQHISILYVEQEVSHFFFVHLNRLVLTYDS